MTLPNRKQNMSSKRCNMLKTTDSTVESFTDILLNSFVTPSTMQAEELHSSQPREKKSSHAGCHISI
jgi:hypothetical protein